MDGYDGKSGYDGFLSLKSEDETGIISKVTYHEDKDVLRGFFAKK